MLQHDAAMMIYDLRLMIYDWTRAVGPRAQIINRKSKIQNPKSKIQNRHGFTLIEVMLTLALLVTLAAFCWPLLQKPFAQRELRAAADQVRAAWVRARVAAMNSDRTYVFRYEPEGRQYRVECRAAEMPTADLALAESAGLATGGSQSASEPTCTEARLPEGVAFTGSETTLDTRSATVALEPDALAAGGKSWSEPILFYPDGTTSTARLELRSERGRAVELSLRGLTGVVNVSDVYLAAEGEMR